MFNNSIKEVNIMFRAEIFEDDQQKVYWVAGDTTNGFEFIDKSNMQKMILTEQAVMEAYQLILMHKRQQMKEKIWAGNGTD